MEEAKKRGNVYSQPGDKKCFRIATSAGADREKDTDRDIPKEVFRDEVAAIVDRRNYENKNSERTQSPKLSLPPESVSREEPSPRLGLRGLAISGGGIRSATFATGVVQALAHRDLLKEMDYLSTVSGGGYIGCGLTWALNGPERADDDPYKEFIDSFGTGRDTLPIGTDDPRNPRQAPPDGKQAEGYARRQALLKYSREHGKYLTPGSGINAFSGLAVVLRGVLLNLLVWIGLVAVLFLLAFTDLQPFANLLGRFQDFVVRSNLPLWWALGAALLMLVFGGRFPKPLRWLALLGLVILVTFQEAENGAAIFRRLEPTLWLAVAGALACVLYGVLTFFPKLFGRPSKRYEYRRFIETLAAPYFIVTALALTIGSLEFVREWLGGVFEEVSLGMIASGIASGLWTHKSASSDKESKIPMGPVATIGSLLLIYGALLGAYSIAARVHEADQGGWVWIALVVVLLLGWLVNTNYISLGRFYRDRLMETFLPDVEHAVEDKTGPALKADTASICTMWNPSRPRGPYHIVNTNLVLVDSDVRTWRTRGGDSFSLSPFYCGSSATGWRRSDEFEQGQMTLATAMAISAAAANPNAGVAGKGLSRSKFVSLLMALLNFRLGSWVWNPRGGRKNLFPPNHFHPGGLYELSGGFKETSAWLMLSDGGHFENLALYEMIRRKLKVIVVLDGGADPDFVFGDLQNAMRRVGADFGARIYFEGDAKPLGELSYERDEKKGSFPRFPGRTDSGHIVGKIRYAGYNEAPAEKKADFEGDLIYLKTTLVKGLSVPTQGYRDAHPAFPDESTADQFFDTEQYEAYRDLGYRIGMNAADDIEAAVHAVGGTPAPVAPANPAQT